MGFKKFKYNSYSFSLIIAEGEVKVNQLAGAKDRKCGFLYGELDLARFNKPWSFAVDLKGNVYFADKTNPAIRKINNTGPNLLLVFLFYYNFIIMCGVTYY